MSLEPLRPHVHPPGVWGWYRLYAGLMALMYVALIGLGLVFPLIDGGRRSDMPAWFMPVLFGCVSAPFAAAYAAAFVVPVRPWAWIYHLVLICIGMTSACCLPACVPLIIFWLKPETRRFFGRE